MDNILAPNVLRTLIRANTSANITVNGVSMNPSLISGDTITVQNYDTYEVGDILVFRYKKEGIIVHRLLKIEDETYYCKGDNAFRIEEITAADIYGKVTLRNNEPLEPWPKWKTNLSYQVHIEFLKNHYSEKKTKTTETYTFYQNHVLSKN